MFSNSFTQTLFKMYNFNKYLLIKSGNRKTDFRKFLRVQVTKKSQVKTTLFMNFKRPFASLKYSISRRRDLKRNIVKKHLFNKRKKYLKKVYRNKFDGIFYNYINSQFDKCYYASSARKKWSYLLRYTFFKIFKKRKRISRFKRIFLREGIHLPSRQISQLSTKSSIRQGVKRHRHYFNISQSLLKLFIKKYKSVERKKKFKHVNISYPSIFLIKNFKKKVFYNFIKFFRSPLKLTHIIQKKKTKFELLRTQSSYKNNIRFVYNQLRLSYNTTPNLNKYQSKKSFIFSRYNAPFILRNNSINVPSKFKFKLFKQLSYVIKKKIYSFLRTNELKRSVLNSRKKQVFTKIVALTHLNKSLFKRLISKKQNTLFFFDTIRSTYLYNTHLPTSDRVGVHKSKLKPKRVNKSNSLRVPRIKFKPGYQRLWRNFRLAFAESIDFKFIYQQQLTRYLLKFYRKLNHKYFSFNENSVVNITIYSRLVPDLSTFDTFFTHGFIFLNGTPLTLRGAFVYKNDFIQLEITNWYYIFSRWLLSYVMKRNLRFKSLIYKKSLAGRYKIMKQVKQRSHYTPRWIFTVKYDFSDIKPFLEVDFFTLSAFIIYDPSIIMYNTPGDIRVTRYTLLRLYNWKYIN